MSSFVRILLEDCIRQEVRCVSPLLSKQFGMGMAVIRDALFGLAEQQLVVLTPDQGFRVTSISRKDLIDLSDLRQDLEGKALRRSILIGDMGWEAGIVSAHHILRRVEYR
jgi:DNA-binding GntR family transcriptional regulator